MFLGLWCRTVFVIRNYIEESFMKSVRVWGLVGVLAGLSVSASALAEITGNRYGLNPVLYPSEISAAEAWQSAARSLTTKNGPIILDVRRVEEYVAGHPVGAYSVPFPHVTKSPTVPNDDGLSSGSGYIGYDITVDEEVGFLAEGSKDGTLAIQDFVSSVSSLIPDRDRPIYLLCATGHRSVQAANALVKYGQYTRVRNIWEGYNGQPKYAYQGSEPQYTLDPATGKAAFVPLDLNHDGVLDNQDKDGWAYYQKLPTETVLRKSRIDKRYISLYGLK
ncbi:rhodanese-like domain-containing protein [Candidatus Woesearchaeota archaeon]|nr:rhodanese-like domain-containing protein [Candidatus Woesearchaeota archaeon]